VNDRGEGQPSLNGNVHRADKHGVDEADVGLERIADGEKVGGESGRADDVFHDEVPLFFFRARQGGVPLRRGRQDMESAAVGGDGGSQTVVGEHVDFMTPPL
jgi:hypothetical protein